MDRVNRQRSTQVDATLDEHQRDLPRCSICGAAARRAAAKFCASCGRRLERGYRPTALLRATYRTAEIKVANAGAVATSRASSGRNVNGASLTSLAFATYALVPYLGIVFCPPAIVLGGLGLAKWRRTPRAGGRAASIAGVALGFALLAAQLFLWWVLYKIPQLLQII